MVHNNSYGEDDIQWFFDHTYDVIYTLILDEDVDWLPLGIQVIHTEYDENGHCNYDHYIQQLASFDEIVFDAIVRAWTEHYWNNPAMMRHINTIERSVSDVRDVRGFMESFRYELD